MFLSREHILNSSDVFPIEFLDMKDDHICLYGSDVLKEVQIDPRNLRFQCEQELKSKLILVKQQYLRVNPKDKRALANLLFRNLTSVAHILRNLLRLKGKFLCARGRIYLKRSLPSFRWKPRYFLKIWQVKKDSARLSARDLKALLGGFVLELDKIIKAVDRL